MPLFDLTAHGELTEVPATNFAAEQVLERTDLQRALRANISVLDPDLLVVAEEFGDFVDVRRRIDLLCVDREGRLVVIELKRTEDGGHMELQALRYAAMVSAMTFDQLSDSYQRYLGQVAPDQVDTARARLAEFLEDAGGEDTVLERRVRIMLVSAGFDPQITTTVLWLNDVYGLDITCIRLVPYRIDQRLLLDVQQVIPLPEAEALMVRLRQRETAARAAVATGGADWTQYVVRTPAGESEPLRKRRAVLWLVHALHESGIDGVTLSQAIPGPRFLAVDGEYDGEELAQAFVAAHPNAHERERRWFLDQPIHDNGRTWVLSKMWGTNTIATLQALTALVPGDAFGFRPVP